MGVCWHLWVSSFYTWDVVWVFVGTCGSVAFIQGMSLAFIQGMLYGCVLALVGQWLLYRGCCMGVCWHLWVSSFYTEGVVWVFVGTCGSVAFIQGCCMGVF